MKRIWTIVAVFCATLTLQARRPNVILIMTDQQAAKAVGYAGNTDVKTPAMDRIAAHGIRFENAYCSFPLSGPSRAAMFTGLFAGESGVDINEMPLPPELRDSTLGQLVSDAGYDCAYAGKWHVNTISLPAEHAFGFRNLKGNGDDGLAEAAVAYLRENHSRPFFLVVSYTNPHNICEFARGQKLPMADIGPRPPVEACPNLPSNFAVAPYDAAVLQFEKSRNYSLYPTVDYSPDDWRQYLYAYYRLVEAVDTQIGMIVDELDRQDLWKDSVIIFTSDHGDGMAAHHWNQKTVLYEESACVPAVICLPGGKHAGTSTDALFNNGVDLMPSICDWTGAAMPSGRSGKSIRAVLEEGEASQDFIVTETNFKQTAGSYGWMVRTSRYKYVLYDKGRYREQLYDMENDRGEMRNLAMESRYEGIVKEHRDILRRWLEEHPGPERWLHRRFIP